MESKIILVGSPSNGWTAYGPFATAEAAAVAAARIGDSGWIVSLLDIETEDESDGD
jgi:hypothetical protein